MFASPCKWQLAHALAPSSRSWHLASQRNITRGCDSPCSASLWRGCMARWPPMRAPPPPRTISTARACCRQVYLWNAAGGWSPHRVCGMPRFGAHHACARCPLCPRPALSSTGASHACPSPSAAGNRLPAVVLSMYCLPERLGVVAVAEQSAGRCSDLCFVVTVQAQPRRFDTTAAIICMPPFHMLHARMPTMPSQVCDTLHLLLSQAI